MKIKSLIIAISAIAACSVTQAQNIIPQPVKVTLDAANAKYIVPARMLVYYYSQETEPLALYLSSELRMKDGIRETDVVSRQRLFDQRKADGVYLMIDRRISLPDEGYKLTVSDNGIVITGMDYAGVFNGIQTLLQLFPVKDGTHSLLARPSLACLEVEDYPRFGYRGMHLDVARTFSSKEDVMRFIDNMSRHKLNKFHWHLTDDEGWRVEIKSHPELALVGGFRGGDSPVMAIYGAWDRKYGGYYTQEEIREVVRYAALRNVEIIPEIDLPGHSRTAGKVYPEILCASKPDTLASGGYDRRNVWCVAREENYALLDDILGELAELFPSKYIHIGGDEVEMSQWRACPNCLKLMKEKGFKDGHVLESYFMSRLEKILASHGKSAAVWNEAVSGDDGLLSGAVNVYGWKNVDVCKEITGKGYRTVVMPGRYFYFDMKYSRHEPGLMWAGIVTTEDVYSFDFEKQGFTPQQMAHVSGVEGAFWSELYLSNGEGYLDRQTYPRICALSELAWTPQWRRDSADFFSRLDTHFSRLREWGINFRGEPAPLPAEKILRPQVSVTCSMPIREKNPLSILEQYNSGSNARTTRTCRKGDYLQFVFDKPVDCSYMEFVTGYSYLPRCQFTFGYAEVMYDGEKEFERYGDLHNGRITIRPDKKVKQVRIVSSAGTNGETSVIFQAPKIVAR